LEHDLFVNILIAMDRIDDAQHFITVHGSPFPTTVSAGTHTTLSPDNRRPNTAFPRPSTDPSADVLRHRSPPTKKAGAGPTNRDAGSPPMTASIDGLRHASQSSDEKHR